MKKLLVVLCAIMVSLGAYAQKGKSEVGINLDLAPTFSTDPASFNLGVGAKYRYGISNKFRLDANFTYYFNSLKELDTDFEKINMWDISVNIQYLLKWKDKLTFYPLAGLGFIKVNSTDDYESTGNWVGDANHDKDIIESGGKSSNIVFNIGAGLEYAITDHINANLEIKFPILVKHVDPLLISLGACYKF